MRKRLVISMTLIEFPDGDTYRDDEVEVAAHVSAEAPVLATDPYDAMLNAIRLAEQTTNELFRRLRECARPEPKPSLAEAVDLTKKAIAAYLRDKADELVGYALPHPQFTLRGWANDLDPPPEEADATKADAATGPIPGARAQAR